MKFVLFTDESRASLVGLHALAKAGADLGILIHKSNAEGVRRTPKAFAILGGSGGMPPRKNFEIESPRNAISSILGVKFCRTPRITKSIKDMIF